MCKLTLYTIYYASSYNRHILYLEKSNSRTSLGTVIIYLQGGGGRQKGREGHEKIGN